MAKTIGLFYGSTTGNTERIATLIRRELGDVEVHDVSHSAGADLSKYDRLIFGVSTWQLGNIQDDWKAFMDSITPENVGGKTIALYGLGDQIGFSDTFVDAMGLLYDRARQAGARLVGEWPIEGYDFEDSRAVIGDHFVGLPLDEDCQQDQTEERVHRWAEQLKAQF